MDQWGIFNDESADYTEAEAVEAGFYTLKDAIDAITERYLDDDVYVHYIEPDEPDDPDDGDDEGEPEIFHYYG